MLITDIEMPEMGGRELIHLVRSKEEKRHVAVIAYTHFGHSNQEETLLELGAIDFLYKPLNAKVVQMRVKNALLSII